MDPEKGFICACTCAGIWYGSVLTVDGDALIVTERFRHEMTTEAAPTCFNGLIYCSQYQFDGTTGELIGKGNSGDNALPRSPLNTDAAIRLAKQRYASDNALPRSPLNTGYNSPASHDLLLLAAGHVYGLTARIGSGQFWAWGATDGTGEVFTMDGERVSRNLMRPPLLEGDKLLQYTTQIPWQPQWGDKFFSITCPMNISGSRLYIRSNDYLYCIEEGRNSLPAKTEGK
jgi:hypothetical protein